MLSIFTQQALGLTCGWRWLLAVAALPVVAQGIAAPSSVSGLWHGACAGNAVAAHGISTLPGCWLPVCVCALGTHLQSQTMSWRIE